MKIKFETETKDRDARETEDRDNRDRIEGELRRETEALRERLEERDRIDRDKDEKEGLRTQLEITRLQLRYEQELRYKEEELRINNAQNANQNETTRADGTDIDTSRANRRLVAISNSMPLNHYAVDVVSDLVNNSLCATVTREDAATGIECRDCDSFHSSRDVRQDDGEDASAEADDCRKSWWFES